MKQLEKWAQSKSRWSNNLPRFLLVITHLSATCKLSGHSKGFCQLWRYFHLHISLCHLLYLNLSTDCAKMLLPSQPSRTGSAVPCYRGFGQPCLDIQSQDGCLSPWGNHHHMRSAAIPSVLVWLMSCTLCICASSVIPQWEMMPCPYIVSPACISIWQTHPISH